MTVVLRHRTEYYELIGECCVDDMMHDEIFDDLETGIFVESDFNIR